jgi:ribosomal protein S26
MKYANGRRTGFVTFCVETAFYNGLLKERYKGDRRDRKTRKKTYVATG